MAEALVAAGAVANIVQLVDFGSKVLLRLNEFLSNPGRVPKTFRHLQTELRVLLDTLKHTQTAIETGFVPDGTREALRPAIDGCRTQIETLDAILAKTLPIPGDSWRKRSTKAILSLYQDGKVKEIRAELYRSIQALTYYHAAASSTLRPATEIASRQRSPPLTAVLEYDQDIRDQGAACHIRHTDGTAPCAGHHIVSSVSSLVQQTQHAFLSTDLTLQRHLAHIYRELGQQRTLLSELKISIEEYTCPNCGKHVSKGCGNPRPQLDNADQLDSISADIFFDCVSRFSRDKSSASIDRLNTNFPGSPGYILERNDSFYPELYATEGLFSNPLFVIAMKQFYIQGHFTHQYYLIYAQTPRCWQRVIVSATFKNVRDLSAIPQVSAPDSDDGTCKILPNAVGTVLNTLLPCVRLFGSVTKLSLPLIEDEGGRIVQESPQMESAEDCLEIAMSNEDEILHDIEVMGCHIFPESEVVVASRMTSSYFAVKLNGQACVERKVPFASAGGDGENGLRDFINDLKLFNSLRGCHGVSQLIGVVFDDAHLHLRSYLYEAPMIFQLLRVFNIANSRSDTIPWSVRELWSEQIAQAIANVHSKGFTVGVLGRHNIGLRADGSAILQRLEASKRHLIDVKGEMPPELRSTDGSAPQQQFDDRTDIFQLGLLLWLLAEHKGNITGSRCSRSVCTHIPRYQCTADHTNPIELPPCCGGAPTYFSDIIKQCRSPNPRARPTARRIAEILSSQSVIEACPRDILELLNTYLDDATTFSVHCDECGVWARHLHYHCYACELGNFDLCPDCVDQGIHCYVPEHKLVKRVMKNGRYVHAS